MSQPDILQHRYFTTPRLLLNSYTALLGLVTGKFTLSECLLLMRRRFKYPDTRLKFITLQRQGIDRFVNKDGSVNLYGHAVHPVTGNPDELFYLIDQIVSQNQYRVELIKDGDIVIDAGANKGIFAIKVAHDKPSTTIYAFEPVHETVVYLEKNCASYPNVHSIEAALGDVTETKPMMIDPKGPDGNHMADSHIDLEPDPDRTEVRNVPVITLDDFVRQQSIPHIDFLKMDVEGYEGRILKGAAESIRKWKPVIVMSAYHAKDDVRELPRILNEIQPGYQIKLEKRSELDLLCQYPK